MDYKLDTITDEELAQLAAEGDRAAFDEIVRRYCRPLVQFVAGRTAVFQDAEDIVQETFLRYYRNIGSFDNHYSLKSWLYTIAYRTCVSAYRKKRPIPLSQEAIRQMSDTSTKAEPTGDGIWSLVRDMKPEDHTVLWLRYKQDMDIDEIAKIMKKTETSVRVHLHRARNRLAKRICVSPESASVCGYDLNGEVFIERTE
ncbi:MAG: RNA polymerase sigma factor [Phycisphaerae bacterium]|nr:RNA polymerase sigma factor [Phycisphaerae bacterium]